MLSRKWMMLILVSVATHTTFAAILEIENRSRFTCDVQPVVDNKDRSTMGPFRYTLQPGSSGTYNSGFYSIKSLRWRINNYFDGNTKLARNYFLAEIPGGINVINTHAKIVILPNGDFQYYENKKNLRHYLESTPLHLKYVYQYTYATKSWEPIQAIVGKTVFNFNAESANDIYR